MMASMIVLMGTALSAVIALYVSSQTGARANGDVLLGVSLPAYALKDKAVLGLVAEYRRAYLLHGLCFALLILPALFLMEQFSLAMVYFSLWFLALLYVHLKILHAYFARLYALKVEKQWRVGSHGMIAIDTEVSRLKHTFMLSWKWFLLPLLILLVPILNNVFAQEEVLPWAIIVTGLVVLGLFCFIYLGIDRMGTKTYSVHTEINLQLNYTFKSQWSKCVIILAVLSSFFYVLLLYATEAESLVLVYAGIFVYLFVMILIVVLSHRKIRRERNGLLGGEEGEVSKDDDRYWIGGILYNNPNDRSLFVEKRMGIGMTMNIGTWGGKLIAVGVVLLLLVPIGFGVWTVFGS